jgi:hypothetical protein
MPRLVKSIGLFNETFISKIIDFEYTNCNVAFDGEVVQLYCCKSEIVQKVYKKFLHLLCNISAVIFLFWL